MFHLWKNIIWDISKNLVAGIEFAMDELAGKPRSFIIFASRYPTSPSEGSLLYSYLKEGMQTKEKQESLELETAITLTCKALL